MISESPLEKRDFRYRLYFWLMDICLIFAAIGLAEHLLDRLAEIAFLGMPPAMHDVVSFVVLAFNFHVPLFLMVAKFMRDEYAEGLWRRSLVALGYLVAVIPFILIYLLVFLHPQATAEPGSWAAPFVTEWNFRDFMARSWMTYMLLFVGVFQFLRWRDSR